MICVKAIEEFIANSIPGGIPFFVAFEKETLSVPQRSRDGCSQLRCLHFLLEIEVEDSRDGWKKIDQVRDTLTGVIPDGAKNALFQSCGNWGEDRDIYCLRITLQTSLPFQGFNS
jgi:hypothetical protein